MAHGGSVDGSDDVVDEILFHFYKKEKVKQMRSRLSDSALEELKAGFLGAQNSALHRAQFLSSLESGIGVSLNAELLAGIGDIFDKYSMLMSVNYKIESQKMLIEALKLFHDHIFSTPTCLNKRKIDSVGLSPVKRPRPPRMGDQANLKKVDCGTVLFKEPRATRFECGGSGSGELCLDADCFVNNKSQRSFISLDDDDDFFGHGVGLNVDKTPCTTSLDPKPKLKKIPKPPCLKKSPEVIILKEVSMKQRMQEMRESAKKVYNEMAHRGSGLAYVKEDIAEDGSLVLSFVSGVFGNQPPSGDRSPSENCSNVSKFAVTPNEVKLYNVVCSLATSSKYSRSVVADIGNCTLKFFFPW